ncbi:DnaD domain protein [Paenibacillus alkalitolerans]|uniref:DnaD domain protein n=1 Tax=Paenibacillus alkalitolerans TaxID=2799335 RepID=UPI0018F2AC9C|nr:DnaD domain protein [Paenibacillus alkalitolerans]
MTDSYRQGLLEGFRLGAVSVPGLFLRCYAQLGLSEIEAMLILHIMYSGGQENNPFPTPEELAGRMSAAPSAILSAIERLVRDGLLMMDDTVEPVTGVVGERYNLSPLFDRLAAAWAETASGDGGASELPAENYPAPRRPVPPARETAASRRRDLFTVFESEFARPLSPLEYERISAWLDNDQYSDSLILAAVKEAVFAGKVNFTYIDRILMEWQKNRITTPEQAKEYTQRFRGGR